MRVNLEIISQARELKELEIPNIKIYQLLRESYTCPAKLLGFNQILKIESARLHKTAIRGINAAKRIYQKLEQHNQKICINLAQPVDNSYY